MSLKAVNNNHIPYQLIIWQICQLINKLFCLYNDGT